MRTQKRFSLAQWARNDLDRMAGEIRDINWTNVGIGAVAAFMAAAFMLLPWLTD